MVTRRTRIAPLGRSGETANHTDDVVKNHSDSLILISDWASVFNVSGGVPEDCGSQLGGSFIDKISISGAAPQ